MRNPHACVLLTVVSPLLGCSLMGLDDFGVTPCLLNDDCKGAAAQLKPSPTACGSAVCEQDTGLCKWQEAIEICDGADNDCDGLIDEDLTISAQKSSSSAAEPAVVSYSVASNSEQTFVAMVSAAPTGQLPAQLLTLPTSVGGSTHELQKDSPAGSYNFAEVALAADATHLVVASINTRGCAFGQVHVGLSDLSRPFAVRQTKPDDAPSGDPSNIAIGIDLDDDHCTGASRKVNASGVLSPGATRPAVASLGTEADGKGALLVWLGTSARTSDPLSDPIQVEALGLEVRDGNPVWLNGRHHGVPTPLGQTTSRSAPAVLALKTSQNYLVAFATELGIQLLTVAPDPSLPSAPSLGVLLPFPAAEQVSLALGNTARNEVGVSWRTGSGADAQVCFTILSLAAEAPLSATSASISQPPPQCESGTNTIGVPVFAPQLLYRPLGFAIDQPSGGWFLSWADPLNDSTQTFHVVRVRDESMTILGESPRQVEGVSLLYPSNDDDGSVGFATIFSTAGGKSQSETNPPLWCE